MRTLVLLLACFAHACHARRVQAMAQHSQGSSDYVQDAQEFVNLLFSLKPEAAFNIAAPGSRFRGSPTRAAIAMQVGEMARQASGSMQQGGEMARRASSLPDHYALDGITVQGGALKTWSFTTPFIERVQVNLNSFGTPFNADIDLWNGPDHTPQKIAVYSEDGKARPFNAVIETPGGQNALRIRNTATLEYPLKAIVETDNEGFVGERPVDPSNSQLIQGGAIKTYSFEPTVGSVAVLMQTDGRPLNARIELLQGPNQNKQVIDLYSENGILRPFYFILQTPGSGHVVRIVNTATMEYPLMCSVEPYEVENYEYEQGPLSVDGFLGS